MFRFSFIRISVRGPVLVIRTRLGDVLIFGPQNPLSLARERVSCGLGAVQSREEPACCRAWCQLASSGPEGSVTCWSVVRASWGGRGT
jgi:hypothetical protein